MTLPLRMGPFWANQAFDRLPTRKGVPVISMMKIAPIGTARSSSRRLRTVMKRTASCGWASTPMPTPRMMAVTTVHQRSYLGAPQPKAGISVQPWWPIAARGAGTMASMSPRD